MKGWILRIYPLIDRYRLVIKTGDRLIYRDIEYKPKIYIDGELEAVRLLIKGLDASNYLIEYNIEKWFKPPWYRVEKKIWSISLPGPKEYREVINWIKMDGRLRLWNTYPDDISQMMYNMNLSTSTLIDIDNLRLLEDPWDIKYEEPRFRRVRLRILDWYGDVIHPFKYPPKIIQAEYIDYGVKEVYRDLDNLISDIHRYSPDIYEFYNTPAYIWFRSIDKMFRLKSRVYIDYGWNVLEPDEYHGYIELSRLSRVDLHEVSRYSIGKILTTIEAYNALKLRRLIPDIRTDKEGFKTLDKLSKVDRGGYIHVPEPGLYWNVAQCDFTSLYPSIIVHYNIGNETVNYYRCSRYILSPESRHRICLDIPSTVAYTLEKILNRRVKLKDLYRETGDPVIYARQNALKWILVTCFGYLGYRNARFGKIEAYETVTSYARNIMYKAIDIARDMGFKIVHALVDSIWIYRDDADKDDYLRYCREVTRETGFRMELDSYFKWLYIPHARIGGSTLNRYLGSLVDGGYKAKGIAISRRDTPIFIKELQDEILTILSDADDIDEFIELLEEAYSRVDKYRKMVISHSIDPYKLVITRRVGKDINRYISRQPHIKAAEKLGIENPYIVKYIVALEGYIPIERWDIKYSYDINYYLDLIDKAVIETPLEIFNKARH